MDLGPWGLFIFGFWTQILDLGPILGPKGKLLGAFGAWGETFQKNRPWDLGHGLES